MSKHSQKQIDRERSKRGRAPMQVVPLEGVKYSAASADPEGVIDAREDRLFRSLDIDNDRNVLRSDVIRRLKSVGLRINDDRIRESVAALDALGKMDPDEELEHGIPKDDFCKAIRQNILLIERALQGNMIIPDFAEFSKEIDDIHAITRENRSGRPADYIPQLDLPEPEVDQFGVGICSIDGQRHTVGDAQAYFPVESTCKPVSYCLALEEHGPDKVHSFMGHEPSGASFNELALDRQNRPHNPMINAGAIMSSALIKLRDNRRMADRGAPSELDVRGWAGSRFDYVMDCWQQLCGGRKPRFSTPVYLSERQTADRNFALAYYMREKGAFPEDVDLHDVLDFYFQCCSIEVNAEMMSVVAATLANGGICPITGARVFKTETVQSCLSLMSSCGMYDYSGKFAFTIGLPAKSGVCGAIMIVIPNIMGICVWSPRLDEVGNSVRGIEFCQHLVDRFNFHNFDILAGASGKRDPRFSRSRQQAIKINELIWAASKGDLGAIQNQLVRGAALNCADYDLRTPLHLAAAQNQVDTVNFFIDQKQCGASIDLNPHDRWGGTPLDDAHLHANTAIVEMLEAAGAVRGQARIVETARTRSASVNIPAESYKTADLIWAASSGDLETIYRLVAQGVPLDLADYDLRTPLHLAAAEGHSRVVQYFISQKAQLKPRDRWGNTPLDDAIRHGRTEVAELIRRSKARNRRKTPETSMHKTCCAAA